MVKVSIRDYMPPYTTWMQVELEDGVCNASPGIQQNEQGKTTGHYGEKDFMQDGVENPDSWDANIMN
ncbi:MAG: hypothetical protein HUJ98_04385 [Bacteroidaceae bacterium]|nr:hypothetical protein [Bacteroidaceae bacterium]